MAFPLSCADAAFTTSNSMGKIPALCAPDGTFLTSYTACVACCEEQTHDGNGSGKWGESPGTSWGPPPGFDPKANMSAPPYLLPALGQYLGYCNVSDVLVTYTVTPTASTAGDTATSVAPSVVTTDVTLPHDFTAAPQTAPSPSSSPSPTLTPVAVSSTGEDRSWIAGPIVGATLGTALVVLSIVFILYRRRKKMGRATDTQGPGTGPEDLAQENQHSSLGKNELEAQKIEKAQLHSDSIAPHELEGGRTAPREELDVEGTYAELPAHGHDYDTSNMAAHGQNRSPQELGGGERDRLGVIGNRSELA